MVRHNLCHCMLKVYNWLFFYFIRVIMKRMPRVSEKLWTWGFKQWWEREDSEDFESWSEWSRGWGRRMRGFEWEMSPIGSGIWTLGPLLFGEVMGRSRLAGESTSLGGFMYRWNITPAKLINLITSFFVVLSCFFFKIYLLFFVYVLYRCPTLLFGLFVCFSVSVCTLCIA